MNPVPPPYKKIDRSRFCATCGRERRPLEIRRDSWRFDASPIIPHRKNGPSPLPGYAHAGWQITNDLIVTCNIYRNGGTGNECHLCDGCLRVGLRAIKQQVDAALEVTEKDTDKDAEIARLTEELGEAQHRALTNDRATLLAEIERLRGVLAEWRKWCREAPGYRTRVQLEALTDACLDGDAGKDGN